MRLAKACQVETPGFRLSDNQQLFVMRRFDLKKDAACRAMEDMALSLGKSRTLENIQRCTARTAVKTHAARRYAKHH